MGEAISPEEELINAGNTGRLASVGYLSPQGVPFRCSSCDYYKKKGEWYGRCVNPKVGLLVEAAGCCNLFSRNGVHS